MRTDKDVGNVIHMILKQGRPPIDDPALPDGGPEVRPRSLCGASS
ncbi:hypothetical protein [Bradyrhizobium sp. LCT2]|nr:hypothetical protein [Bradyrhizobium sp. LCT2]